MVDREREDFRNRWTQFQHESEPIISKLVNLSTMFRSAILKPDGMLEFVYSDEIRDLMDKYNELKMMLMRRIMGPFMPTTEGRE